MRVNDKEMSNSNQSSWVAPKRLNPQRRQSLLRHLRQLALALTVILPMSSPLIAGSDLRVTIPNGYANLTANDLRLRSTAGEVRWMRVWDGQEWKFNPQWESLSQSWKNLNGSQTADTTAGTVSAGTALAVSSSGGGSGCWVWVDEDRAGQDRRPNRWRAFIVRKIADQAGWL